MKRSRKTNTIGIFEQMESRTFLHAGSLASDELVSEGEPNEVVPNFSLIDTNPTSDTYNQRVSPRDFDYGVSAWYFGHST